MPAQPPSEEQLAVLFSDLNSESNPMVAIFDLAAKTLGWSVLALPAARALCDPLWEEARAMPEGAAELMSLWANARMAYQRRKENGR